MALDEGSVGTARVLMSMSGLRGTVLLWDMALPGPRWPTREARGASSSSEEDADDDVEVECDVARRELDRGDVPGRQDQ